MRLLIIALLAAFTFPVPSLSEETETINEIVSLFKAEALASLPQSVHTPATVDDLVAELRTVDPYLSYEPPVPKRRAGSEANLSLGINVSTLGEDVLLMPQLGGPAFAAGLHDPVYLQAINGSKVDGLQPFTISELVSADGDTVELALVTATGSAHLAIRPRLSVGPWASVEVLHRRAMMRIRIHDFLENETAKRLAEALEALPTATHMIVLDLRLNPGGSLFEALDAASLFLPADLPIASTRDRQEKINRFVSVPTSVKVLDIPVAVLVSDHTASAAEAFTRALHYHGRALVLGRPTFGKCRSQRRFQLSDGSVLLVSNLAILSPDGTDCEGSGVIPDDLVTGPALLSTQELADRACQRVAQRSGKRKRSSTALMALSR